MTTLNQKRGRPPGQFEENRAKVLRFLTDSSPYRGSNEDLGAILQCSDRQAQRYITSLKDLGVIHVSVARYPLGASQWKNSRVITVVGKES